MSYFNPQMENLIPFNLYSNPLCVNFVISKEERFFFADVCLSIRNCVYLSRNFDGRLQLRWGFQWSTVVKYLYSGGGGEED